MKAFQLRFASIANRVFVLALVSLISTAAVFAQAQASSADLAGTVTDPTGAIVPGATVAAKNLATNDTRTVTTNESGEYKLISLPPGDYQITAEAKTFKKTVISPVKLTVGQSAELTIKLEVGTQDVIVNVSGADAELVETTRSSVASTIDQQRIQNLPINERSATGFALTLSTVGRDNGRPIGPAPTSGLNIGGQRGRSTQVNVDGADFTDNSINAARSTVSQEAVQEYQVNTNSYMPEFGRATGGVVNVVTKRGTNTFTGNVFGYIRDKAFQSRPAFAPVDKPDFRRTQYGFTLGGPIKEDRTFFFFAYEGRRRDESGFFTSNPAAGLTSLTVPVTGLGNVTFGGLTAAQVARVQQLLAGGGAGAAAAVQYLFLASSGANTALTGTNTLPNPGSVPGVALGAPIGPRFFLSGAPVPVTTTGTNGLPIAFRPLNNLQKVFPITDRSNYFTLRGDHVIDDNNRLTLRLGYNKSDLTGIQVESQNQSLGQNDFSRTGITNIQDYSFTAGWDSTLGGSAANEFRFQFGKRRTAFTSQNGEAVAYNISDVAFIGRELFSPVRRDENRFQLADNFNFITGSHTFKFGADFNWVEIPEATFELNFAGLFNFGPLSAATLNSGFAPLGLPDLTPVQAYGLGFPSIFIQGFGNPVSKFKNKPVAFYAQDSWKLFKNFTLNYGVRYDFEFTQKVPTTPFRDSLSGINLSAADILAAQDAIGVQQGFPRDKNNWAPRVFFAWDLFGDQKTVLRGGAGIFYDHPLLAVGFNSDIADAVQQQQAVLTPGSPAPTSLLNAVQVFQGTVCGVPGSAAAICGAAVTPGVASSAQYQFGRQRFNDQTFPGFGAVLPFTLPVTKNFEYASATQANLTIERQLMKNMSVSVGYIGVFAHHLPRPGELNTPDIALQIENYRRCFGVLPTNTTQVATVNPATCNAPGGTFVNVIPGMISVNTVNGQRVIAPAVANFFRPSGPNYFLAQALSGGAVTKAVLDSQLGGTVRTPGVISPFGSVNAQQSDGNSSYNAMNVELKRRFANNFTFLASYTWSHSIDDSSDLQTLLVPQNVKRFDLEKADSLFDQRHRFVFSGLMASPDAWRSGGGFKKFLADFTVAPIIEFSSGRPFNILTGVDSNNDQSTSTDRPNVGNNGVLVTPGAFQTGNLGRNMGITHNYFTVDLGVTRKIRFGDRISLDLIAQGFNMFNRFNEAAAAPFIDSVNAFGQRAGNGRYFSRPTAAYDSRNFQFGVKFNF